MKLKAKLASLIIGFVMVASMLFFGVWAASSANVTLGGTISFSSTNVYAEVTGKIEGAATGTKELDKLEFKSGVDTPSTDVWKNNNLTFDEDNTITITIKIQNLATDRKLYASVTDTVGTITNVDKTITEGANALVLEPYSETATTDEATVVITMKVHNTDLSVDETNYAYLVELDSNAPYTHEFMKYDKENNYYYLEMGEYNNAPVRWRYVSSDGETRFAASKENAPVTTTGSTGYFILETYPAIKKTFDSSSTSIDYSSSGLRSYLITETTATYGTSFIGDLNIETTNTIYSKITKRSLSDLAIDSSWESWSDQSIEDLTFASMSTTQTEKLWIPSVKELLTMVGGQNVSDGTLSWSRTNLKWEGTSDEYETYWTRSTSIEPSMSGSAVTVENIGGWWMTYGDTTSCAVRPMFCLTF